MQQISRRTFLELASLASAGLIGGCGGTPRISGSENFPVVVFSDVHFQPYINPFLPGSQSLNKATLAANMALAAQLDAADASQWPAIFEGPGNASNYAVSAPGADTNYALLALALASIKQNLGASPAVIFTGDFLGHGLDQLYSVYSVNKTADEAAAFVDKTLTFVLQQIRAAVGTIPVYFALGNCDSYTGYGPSSSFLANNAQQLCTLALNGVGNQQDVIRSITEGGYYSVEPAGMNLMIIALNTIALSPLVQTNGDASESNQDAVNVELSWFDSRLAAARSASQKVWLLMHVPPGADEGHDRKEHYGQRTPSGGDHDVGTQLSGYVHADTPEVSGSDRDDACRPYTHGRISYRAAQYITRDFPWYQPGLCQRPGLQDIHPRSTYTCPDRLQIHQLRPLRHAGAVW
ncbi:MAG TPA: metallophosphoesterase [Terracidiphilus sp.]|jgi:hypothetical protein